MALYKTKGIVLNSRAFDESAKLVTFFTKDYGKISVIAKGAKRPTSKFGGRLETFSYAELLMARGRSLDILSQMEMIESFQPIRENPAWLNLAFYFIKVIQDATLFGQNNPRLFKLLLVSLKKLIDGPPTPCGLRRTSPPSQSLEYIVKFFEVNFLRVEGLYRKDRLPEDIIAEHLQKDIRWLKKQTLAPGF